jgi:hypothetical protein
MASWRIICTPVSMKAIGIILIVAGIALLIFRGFNLQTKEKVVDVGPLEVNKTENRWVGWPVYTGAIAIIAGVIMIVADRKRSVT